MEKLVQWLCIVFAATGFTACGSVTEHPAAGDGGVVPIDSAPARQSCATPRMTCGASGTDDCCNSLEIPGGSYARLYDVDANMNIVNKSAPATIGDLRLDKYEVTVGRFRAFVTAGSGTQVSPPADGTGAHARISGSGWNAAWNASLPANAQVQGVALTCDTTFQTWTDLPGGNEDRPMNCVSWYEAMAFCIWDGGYLPTEAEWTYAAAGGDQQRRYPWSVPAGAMLVGASYASYSPDDGTMCIGDGSPACALTDLLRVGSDPKGDGRWGQSDLGGNVNEWVLDWYVTPYASPCMDCAITTGGPGRVVRGGSYNDDAPSMLATTRFNRDPTNRNGGLGFRCARAP
jgi:formylglycine-generating enzyme required for sulfatase activity